MIWNKKKKTEQQTVNEYINVADIKDNILYTKDNYILSFVEVSPISISTMSKTDIRILSKTLCSEFASNKENIRFFKIAKPVDISSLISEYREKYKTSVDTKQKELLRGATLFLHKYATNGNEVENHFYVIVREKYNGNNTLELEKKTTDIIRKFASAKIQCSICDTEEVARLCNLFANPSYANVEDILEMDGISIINDVEWFL